MITDRNGLTTEHKMETQYKGHTKALAAAGLIVTTAIWGSAFVVMKNSLDVLPPTWLIAARFTVASAIMAAVFFRRIRTMDRETFVCGVKIGLMLGVAYLFQTYGLKYTTASKNAFITTLYVIIVPFLHGFLNRKWPGGVNIAAALLAVAGLALLSLQGDLSVNFGDLLTLICGVSFAFQVVYIDRYTEKHDPILLSVIQIMVTAVMGWCLAPFLDGAFPAAAFTDRSLIFGLCYMALFSTTICFILQNVGQKYLSADTSSILLSLESVFGAVFSVIFLHDEMTGRMIAGCALMFLAVILSETDPAKIGKLFAGKNASRQ